MFTNSTKALVETIHFLSQKGWIPATSSNFSIKQADNPESFWVSKSGVDKHHFTEHDLLEVDMQGKVLHNLPIKSSAETLIHCSIYRQFPHTQCVLHSHSVHSTVLSRMYLANKVNSITFQGYEIQKAFPNITTHDSTIALPIFANSQDMVAFCVDVEQYFAEMQATNQSIPVGFLIAGHGLYTWGDSVFAAKRHMEAWEFLLECHIVESTLISRL